MNQARFRYSNERLRRTAAHIRFEPSDRVPFLCQDDESTHERIVEAEDGYAIVEKIDAGAEAARLHLHTTTAAASPIQPGAQVHTVCRRRLGGSYL
jgi:hypothetical protein